MEIPLEILRAILSHAELILNFTELLQLRLVNSIFERELLSRLFTDHRSLRAPLGRYKGLPSSKKYRFINGYIWNVAPQSLRKKYIRYRLDVQSSDPSLFAYVFLPFYERWVLDQGIAPDNITERNRVLDDLLDLVVSSKLAGATIAHDSRRTPVMIERTFPVPASALEPARQERTDFEVDFAKFAFAALNDEPQATRMLERGMNLKRKSLCFGSSVFEFCIRRGSIALLRQILEQDRTLVYEKKRPYKIFEAAAERMESGRECVKILLYHARPLENNRRRASFLKFLMRRAGRLGHLPIVQGVLDWFEENWHPSSEPPHIPQDCPVAAREFLLWFSDPECRRQLLQCTYSVVLQRKRYGGTKTASPRDIFFKKPGIALLHLLLQDGVDVDDLRCSSGREPPFNRAIQRGMLDWVDAMLQAGAGRRRRYTSALCYAHDAGVVDEIIPMIQKYGHELVRIPDEHWTWFSQKWNGGTYYVSWRAGGI